MFKLGILPTSELVGSKLLEEAKGGVGSQKRGVYSRKSI